MIIDFQRERTMRLMREAFRPMAEARAHHAAVLRQQGLIECAGCNAKISAKAARLDRCPRCADAHAAEYAAVAEHLHL